MSIDQNKIEKTLTSYGAKYELSGSYGDKYVNIIYDYRVFITPIVAKYLISNHILLDRKIYPIAIKKYKKDFENNDWQDAGDPIRFDQNLNRKDGQHRLFAIQKSNIVGEWMCCKFGIDDSVKIFDANKPRTLKDQLTMNGQGLLAKYSGIITSLVYLDINNGTFSGNESMKTKVNVAKKFEKEIIKYQHVFDFLESHQPLWASIIWTAYKYPNQTANFINQITVGINLANDSPAHILRSFINNNIGLNKSSANTRGPVAMITLYCFNEHLNSRTITVITDEMFKKENSYDKLK